MSSASGVPFQSPVPPQAMDPSAVASFSSFSFWFGIVRSTGSLFVTLVVGSVTGIVQAGGYLVRALVWLLSSLYVVTAWPVAQGYALLRFLLSPVTYTLSYVFAPLMSFFYFLGRLRPLYTYLGSAAFVGIVTGLVLKFASSYFFVVLSLDDNADAAEEELESNYGREEEATEAASSRRSSLQHDRRLKTPGRHLRSIGQPAPLPSRPAAAPVPLTAPTLNEAPLVAVKTEDAILSPQDDVWQWLEEFNPKQPAVAVEQYGGDTAALLKKPSARPGGLLALTIMEESSSE
ncbi:hypothetical protein SBRCBS47491_003313 [Sporothrix bragantina]|uniref:Uncharacterized protein n=1 Tax=Sporothrix bragantina TaxID=671064 RepID=A0ABP0BEB9_9PEZI